MNGRRAALLIAAGVTYAIISLYTLDPLLDRLTGHPADLSEFADVRGNASMLLFWLLLSWVLGALGEELAYRGYILNRIWCRKGPPHSRSPFLVALCFSGSLTYHRDSPE